MTDSPVQGPSFESIYRELAPAVHGYLRGHRIDDAEAVTQDVFLAVFSRIDGVRGGEDGVRTLVFSIAHARAVDHHRARARRPVTVEYETEKDPRVTASAEELAVTESGDEVTSILSLLKDDHREVLLLRVLADLPLERVATVMGKSVGAVKQLQRRALLALRDRPELDGWRTR